VRGDDRLAACGALLERLAEERVSVSQKGVESLGVSKHERGGQFKEGLALGRLSERGRNQHNGFLGRLLRIAEEVRESLIAQSRTS
jgi:hypothetical protein